MSLPVYYSEKMVADSLGFSPSAAKPAQVVASWKARGLAARIFEPAPATVEELCLAHDRPHVEAVLGGREENGFGNRCPAIAASLPYTTGAMLAAARHAVRRGGIVCAPCSGFHHAGYRTVSGFCTFNGLMVTACALRAEGLARRVGILDCDMHYGDGTENVLDAVGARPWVTHVTAGATYFAPSHARAFFADLPELVRQMAGCDVVLYQAGADPHIDDPLGGWLTTGELRARDAVVFRELCALRIPVVWNLAGGYQKEKDGSIPKVLAIHENTAVEALRALECGPWS